MSIDRLMIEAFEDLEGVVEESVKQLSGSVNAFGMKNTYSTTEQGSVLMVEVSSNRGYVGSIEIDLGRNMAVFMDERSTVVKQERINRKPTKRQMENYYVPELINRTSTPDMFGT